MSFTEPNNAAEAALLVRAVESGEFKFIVVRHNHLSFVEKVLDDLRKAYPERTISRIRLPLGEYESIGRHAITQASGVLIVEGFEKILQDESTCILLNQQRDKLTKLPLALVVFVPESLEILRSLQKALPDFWAIRNLEIEFHREATEEPRFVRETSGIYVGGTKEEKLAEIERLEEQLREALDGPATIGYRADLANRLGSIHFAIGEYTEAFAWFRFALGKFIEVSDREGEGRALNNLSRIYKARGDYDMAFHYLELSLKIQQEIGDRAGEGVTLNNIGQIFKARGDYDTALRYLERSLKISQEFGDRAGEGGAFNNISQIYAARGDNATALRYLEQSLKIMQEIGDRLGEGTTLNNFSQIYDRRGDYDTALRYLGQSLNIQREIGDISGLATTLHNIGTISYEREDFEAAILYFLKAQKIFKQVGSPDVQHPEGYLGAILEKLGEARYQEILSQINLDEI